jgi:hypothetical protein
MRIFFGDIAMREAWMKQLSVLVCCGALSLAANAAAILPENMQGSWGTSASLWIGKGPQAELHLTADGFGLFIGSSHEGTRADGVDNGKSGPRAVMGFPVQATSDGETLSLRARGFTERDIKELAGMVISCSHEAEGPTITCIGPGPDKTPIRMTRRGEAMPADIVQMIEKAREKIR